MVGGVTAVGAALMGACGQYLSERGVFSWSEWTASLAGEDVSYERWLETLERLVAEKGLTDEATLARYRHAWAHAAERTPHGTPIELEPADF